MLLSGLLGALVGRVVAAVGRDAVDDVERRGAERNGVDAPNPYHGRVVEHAVGGGDVHARRLALHGLLEALHRPLGHVRPANGRHRARQLAPQLGAVAHDHYFVQVGRVGGQRHVDHCLAAQRHFLSRVANEGINQRPARGRYG